MLDQSFFKKYQKLILWFANTKIGKWFFQFEKMGHSLEYGKITAIFPNAISCKVEENKYVTQFFGRAEYSLKIQRLFNWLPFNVVKFAKFDGQWVLQPKFGLTVSTFNPDADPESTSVDGNIYSDTFVDWNTAHDATTGTSNSNDVSGYFGKAYTYQANNRHMIFRTFALFDTSALPDGDIINEATFSVYVISKNNDDNDGNDFISIVQSTPASNTDLVNTDFDNCGAVNNPTEGIDLGDRKDITNISISAYLDFPFNATGIGWVSKTGITKLGIREGHDILDDPLLIALGNIANDITGYFADNGSNKPKLTISHGSTIINASVSNITSSVPAPTLSLGCTIQTTVLNVVSSVIDPLIKIIFRFKDKKPNMIELDKDKQPKIIKLDKDIKPEMIKLDKDKKPKIIE